MGCLSSPLLRPMFAGRWTDSPPTTAGNRLVCAPDLWQPSILQFLLKSSSMENKPVNICSSSNNTSRSNFTYLFLASVHNRLGAFRVNVHMQLWQEQSQFEVCIFHPRAACTAKTEFQAIISMRSLTTVA